MATGNGTTGNGPSHTGRKTKLTPELQALIVQALSVGATHRLACDYAGITRETFYTWVEKGREGTAPYADFFDQVTRTQGRAAVGWLAKIEAAASDGDWRAVAWKLERRFPEEYGKTVQEQRHTGAGGGPIQYQELPAEQRQERIQELTRKRNGHAPHRG